MKEIRLICSLCFILFASLLLSAHKCYSNNIPQNSWVVCYVDSQEVSGEHSTPVQNAFDADISTIWHTEWSINKPLPPHELQIDLGQSYEIGGFRYLPRQDGSLNGGIGHYEFYVSKDGTNWGNAVISGEFAADALEKEVHFVSVTGRYVRLRALTEVNGNPWTSVAEINIVQCIKPSIKIVQPHSHSLQTSTDLHVSTMVCLDSQAHDGWGVKFKLDGGDEAGGAEFIDYEWPFETAFIGLDRSEHIVEAILIDEAGNEISSLYSKDLVSQIGIGDYYVAFGDSITLGLGDNFPSDDVSGDGRNSGGGFEPLLNDLLTDALGNPHTIVNEGTGGITSAVGAEQIQSIMFKHPEAQKFLILLGTNDSYSNNNVNSGLGLNSDDAGYERTFKDNMQKIISAIITAGKKPIIAKVPITLGACSYCSPFQDPATAERNILIKEYNQVIDELVSLNNIATTPPDFYSYFAQNQEQFSDNLHPSGTGYRSMAYFWFNALVLTKD